MSESARVLALFAVFVLTAPAGGVAQNYMPNIYEISAGNFFGVGSRGIGMGCAQIAAGMDGTALVYNPAVLARIRRMEALVGLSHERFSNDRNRYPSEWIADPVLDGGSRSYTRLNAMNATFPVPTYRGSAVVAFGVNRVSSFDQLFQFDVTNRDGSERQRGTRLETGGLYLWTAGGAIDLSPRLSIGAALNLYHGKYDYTWNSTVWRNGSRIEDRDYTGGQYVGVSAKAGLVTSLKPYLSAGAVIESPIGYEIEGDFLTDRGRLDGYVYEVKHPFSFGAGAAFYHNRLQLAIDLHYTDWRQMEYTEYVDMILANNLINDYYREALRINIGAEYLVPVMGAKVRGGYIRDPLPFAGFLIKNDRDFFTLGVGFLIDRVMTFDLAFVTGSYEYAEPIAGPDGRFDAENATFSRYSVNRFYVSTAFRL